MDCSVCTIARDIGDIKRDLARVLLILQQQKESAPPPNPTRIRNRAFISDDSDSESIASESECSVDNDSDYEPDPPKLSSSPHCDTIGKVKLHIIDGPYMIGDPLSLDDISKFDFAGNHYIRWMVWSTDPVVNKHCKTFSYDHPTAFFCDWCPQVVDSNSENQRECLYQWSKYKPLLINGDNDMSTFSVAPLFYSYDKRDLYDMTDVKVSCSYCKY